MPTVTLGTKAFLHGSWSLQHLGPKALIHVQSVLPLDRQIPSSINPNGQWRMKAKLEIQRQAGCPQMAMCFSEDGKNTAEEPSDVIRWPQGAGKIGKDVDQSRPETPAP